MNSSMMKRKLLEELMDHMDSCEGKGLKDMMDSDSKPEIEPMGEEGMPKGLAVEKIEVMPKDKDFDSKADEAIEGVSKPKEEEMSDSELAELLKKYLK